MRKLIFLMGLLILGLSGLCLVQWRTIDRQKGQLAALRQENDQTAERIDRLEASGKRLEQERDDLLQQAQTATAQLQAHKTAELQPAPGTPASTSGPETNKQDDIQGGFGKMVAKMMQDPEMKKFMRNQQRAMLDQMYSPLIKKLGLSADETTAFKDLVADHMVATTETATSLFDGTNNMVAIATNAAASEQKLDEQLKSFLGEARYADYEQYKQTLGERMQLNMYNQQNSGTLALTEPQQEALLNIMKEEKQNVGVLTGQPTSASGNDPANWQAFMSDEAQDKLLQNQETLNQRVYDRARTILSSDQLGAFAEFQTNQLQMTRMGLGMARKLMGNGSGQ